MSWEHNSTSYKQDAEGSFLSKPFRCISRFACMGTGALIYALSVKDQKDTGQAV